MLQVLLGQAIVNKGAKSEACVREILLRGPWIEAIGRSNEYYLDTKKRFT